jgi:hypothetical protein
MLPFGFITSSNDTEVFVDDAGDVWTADGMSMS